MTTTDVHALTGPYVLDAVSDEERADFDQHLATCADCSTEVSDLRETATKLGAYVATPPPAGLKPKVMNSVHTTRQQPPLLHTPPTSSSGATASSRARPPGRPVRRSATRPGIARRPFARRSLTRRSLALAAAFLAIAASGAIALDQYRDKTALTAVSTRAATILTQPDARTIHGAVTGGGQATVVLSSRQDAAVVLIRDLKPLPGHQTYQLWLIDAAHHARSIGLSTAGTTLRPTVVNGGVSGQTDLAVTVEPDGGSATPTVPSGGLQPVVPLVQGLDAGE
ncbi:anti-sigma factor [Kribbella koreensis]|uniref:Regulator of SigK n=1 Tax=Kribbella koreensis TaxID=57909 RepID=A0ABN1RTL5_9ACTN